MKKIFFVIMFLLMMTTSVSAATEGPGFSSPEGATEAYLQGLVDNDLEEMLAACAVETYVDNYNIGEEVSYSHSLWNTTADGLVPQKGEFTRELDIEVRRSRLVEMIRFQYLKLIGAEIQNVPHVTYYEDDGTVDEFLDSYFIADDSEILSSIRFTGTYLDVNDITCGLFNSENNMINFRKSFAWYGVDEAVCLAPVIEAGGEQYLLAIELGRYADKWYVLGFHGRLGILLNISYNDGGLASFDEL